MRHRFPFIARPPARLIGVLLAATMLQGCETVSKLNVLAAIDGPFVSPSEREALEREALEQEAALAQAAAAPSQDIPQLAQPESDADSEPANERASALAAGGEAEVERVTQAAVEEVTPAPPVVVLALPPEPEPPAEPEAEIAPESSSPAPLASVSPGPADPDFIGPVLPPGEMAQMAGTDVEPANAELAGAEPAELAILQPDQGPVSQSEAEAIAQLQIESRAQASEDNFAADFAAPDNDALETVSEALQLTELAEPIDSAAATAIIPPEAEPVSEQEALAMAPQFAPETPETASEPAPAPDLPEEETALTLTLPPEEPAAVLTLPPEPVEALPIQPTPAANLAIAADEAVPETVAEALTLPEAEPETEEAELALSVTPPTLTPAAPAAGIPAPEAEQAPVSLIGPDFLPPDDEEAQAPESVELAPALASAADPIAGPAPALIRPAPEAAQTLIGPVLEETTPATPATSLPSAFDFVIENEDALTRSDRVGVLLAEPPAELPAEQFTQEPVEEDALALAEPILPPAPAAAPAPTPAETPTPATLAPPEAEPSELQREAEALGFSVVTALPTPGASPFDLPAGTGAEAYVPFYEHVVAKLEGQPTGGGRESMLLLDPPSLDPALQICGNRPPAVLIDLDPANGLMPLVGRSNPRTQLAALLESLRQRGVTIYWISGHGPGAASAIRQRLITSTLDPSGTDPLIVTRFAGESKQERRYGLGDTNCLLAIMGDHRADFDELYDFVLDPIMAAPLEGLIGDGWFLAPPPLD